jgi:hypothetical protein
MYNVTMQKNVDLDQEEASRLVGQVLKEDFDFISREINSTVLINLLPFQAEDLRRSIEVRAAMKVLLTYYLTHNDHTEFFELQRVLGNVD